jgi:hypothetical protein
MVRQDDKPEAAHDLPFPRRPRSRNPMGGRILRNDEERSVERVIIFRVDCCSPPRKDKEEQKKLKKRERM